MTPLYLYDNYGNQIGTVKGLLGASCYSEVNGEHNLTIRTTQELTKRQRIVCYDYRGIPREYIISEIEETHGDGVVTTTAICEESIAELTGDYIEDRRPEGGAAAALSVALENTRWEVGQVDVPGTYFVSLYHISVREALNKIAETFGGEISMSIELTGADVTARRVNLTTRVGADTGKRFTYSKDLVGITRHVEIDDVCTALYGYGKGVEKYDEEGEATGGYGRKLTFGEINDGKDYVEDPEALKIWGRPDDAGGLCHVFGQVEFSECEDMEELKRLTEEALKERTEPRVTYTADVINLRAAGLSTEGVSEGDRIYIIDTAFPKTLRLQGRVISIDEDLMAPENTTITLGNILTLTDELLGLDAELKDLRSHAATWDAAGDVRDSFLNAVIERLNLLFESAGTYKYEDWQIGIMLSNVPLDENYKPKRTPAWAMQLSSAGFRIANSLTPEGEWNWRTFGTGEGFTADNINAGTIQGGSNYWNLETGDLMFKQGSITDAQGNIWNMSTGTVTFKNGRIQSADGLNYWNLTTGEFSLQGTKLKVDGQTLDQRDQDVIQDASDAAQGLVDALDRALTQEEVFDRLTGGKANQGIYLDGTNLYINAEYIKTGTLNADLIKAGILTDAEGLNYWNLATGDLMFKHGSITDAKGNKWDMTNGTITITNGSLNASLINAGIIQDKQGNIRWNLDQGTWYCGPDSGTKIQMIGGALRYFENNIDVGYIGASRLQNQETYKALAFNLENGSKAMWWAYRMRTSDDIYTIKLAYYGTSVYESGASFDANMLHAGCTLDMHNFNIKDPQWQFTGEDSYTGGGFTNTMWFGNITARDSNGAITGYMKTGLTFVHGILVSAQSWWNGTNYGS